MPTLLLNPTDRDVQWLVDRPRGEGQIVSCYADISVDGAVRPLWREFLDDEVKRIGDAFATDDAARRIFEQNITGIRKALSSRRAASAKGMAVFASAQRDFIQAFTIGVPVVNRLVVNEEPYVMPLLEVLNRQRRYLVVHTDTHRGRLYTAVPGATTLIEEIDEDVPKRQRSTGELWGTQQATIARHRRDHVLHYFKELAREVERTWPEERYDGIVLLGEHEVLEAFRKELPESLARRIVGEAPHAWVGRQPSLDDRIDAIRIAHVRHDDQRALDEIKRRSMENHQIAAGPQAVIDAIRHDQVGVTGTVVMEPDRGAPGWRCTGCGSLFASAQTQCPLCSSPCETTNLWQAIALLASTHAVPVHVVEAGAGVEKHGSVVALLTRGAGWMAGSPAMVGSRQS